MKCFAIASKLEAITIRLEAITIGLEFALVGDEHLQYLALSAGWICSTFARRHLGRGSFPGFDVREDGGELPGEPHRAHVRVLETVLSAAQFVLFTMAGLQFVWILVCLVFTLRFLGRQYLPLPAT